jgi:lysophospholipase L1-like esterase
MTVGGNDLFSLTRGFQDGKPVEELWAQTETFVAGVRAAVEGLVADGHQVVFTNLYEFTDGTGDTPSCPGAALAGFEEPITDPALAEMVVQATEEYGRIAADTGTDLVFLLETFCGHGFHHDDPEARCYLGPDADLWFDFTCIHPNPDGHEQIADMFEAVITDAPRTRRAPPAPR